MCGLRTWRLLRISRLTPSFQVKLRRRSGSSSASRSQGSSHKLSKSMWQVPNRPKNKVRRKVPSLSTLPESVYREGILFLLGQSEMQDRETAHSIVWLSLGTDPQILVKISRGDRRPVRECSKAKDSQSIVLQCRKDLRKKSISP